MFGVPTIKAPQTKRPEKRPFGTDPRLSGMVDYFKGQREGDVEAGKARFDPLFGMNNPEMAEIIKARRAAAFGTDGMADQLRSQGVAGINSTMATGLRGLRGSQALSGVRGGAALGQAMPVLSQANQARSGLESNIAIADMERRRTALDGLESTMTGERAGSLGAQFGWAGLGAGDRNNALQYITSADFMANARKGVGAGGGGGAQKEGKSWVDPETYNPMTYLPEKYQKYNPSNYIPKELDPMTYMPTSISKYRIGG